MVTFLVFKIAPVGSYGPAKMRSSSHIPSKVNGAPFEISKYKSDSVASLILTLLKCEKNIVLRLTYILTFQSVQIDIVLKQA